MSEFGWSPGQASAAWQPRAEITATRWQAGTSEVREWAAGNGFQIGTDRTIPEQAITAYNQTHPDRPYRPRTGRATAQ
jgi:hypothetical protein